MIICITFELELEQEGQRETERDRDRQRETERDRERQRETERDRERQRETEKDVLNRANDLRNNKKNSQPNLT